MWTRILQTTVTHLHGRFALFRVVHSALLGIEVANEHFVECEWYGIFVPY
jgi:hypothetical protein